LFSKLCYTGFWLCLRLRWPVWPFLNYFKSFY